MHVLSYNLVLLLAVPSIVCNSTTASLSRSVCIEKSATQTSTGPLSSITMNEVLVKPISTTNK